MGEGWLGGAVRLGVVGCLDWWDEGWIEGGLRLGVGRGGAYQVLLGADFARHQVSNLIMERLADSAMHPANQIIDTIL